MNQNCKKVYDYIIVGAGSAGCVLAERLSADLVTRVLLLEAGGKDRHWSIRMPSALGGLISADKYNWDYLSEPEPYLDGRRICQPRGKVLGGSSSINGMIFIRGHAFDYDRWSEKGCTGWSYAEVLPYFKRSECFDRGDDEYHGSNGHLRACSVHGKNPIYQAFLQAGAAAGYPLTDDFNGYQQEGFGYMNRTTHGGERWSTARGFLSAASKRRNLTTVTGALVTRVIFEQQTATGVLFELNGKQIWAKADQEVVLSAGAINSPHLLMLSGVGAAAELRKWGIEPVHELDAVGKNLSDHPDIVMQYTTNKSCSIRPSTRWPRKALVGLEWFLFRSGLATSNHFEVGAFIRSGSGIKHPDLQLTFMPLAVKPGTTETIGRHSYQIHIDLMRPTSLGEVTLQSADARIKPRVVFNYLKTAQDIADLRASVELCRELVATSALKTMTTNELLPGDKIQSDADIDAWIRQTVETGYHACGSCQMGGHNNDNAVVDPQLRVRGLNKLRVIDASVMPDIVSGNTNAPTVMIAEKGADLLLGKTPLAAEKVPVWQHPDWQSKQR